MSCHISAMSFHRHVRFIGPHLTPPLDKLFVTWGWNLLHITCRDVEPGQGWRLEPSMLISLRDVNARSHRDLKPRSLGLGIIIRMILAGNIHHQPVWFSFLDT